MNPAKSSRVGLQRRTGKRFLKPQKSHEQRGASSYSGARRSSAVVSGTLPAELDYLCASCLGSYPPWPQGRGRPWFRAAGAFPWVREPNGSLALHAHGAPGPFATPWGGALARPVPLRGLKRAFHPFARRPGFLHCALHLGLRSPRFFRLVSNLVILSSRNPSPVLLSTSRCLLGHHSPKS